MKIGVVGKGGPIKPLSATWPSSDGRFRLVLPASAAGTQVYFWQSASQFYSKATARPGGPVDLGIYPSSLPLSAPQALASLRLPG